jgi:hypothetical protein
MKINHQSEMNEYSCPFIPQHHTFSISKKLTADSMMPYCLDGKKVFKKVSHVIQHDPLYVWNRLYSGGNNLSLAKCAHNKLMLIMLKRHPDLYMAKEKKKLQYKKHTIAITEK